MSDIYYCVLCEWVGEIPKDAQQLTTGRAGGAAVYRFGDGTVHSIKKVKKQKAQRAGRN